MNNIALLLADLDWQTPIALCIVGIAVVLFIRQIVGGFTQSGGSCGGCSKCPTDQESDAGMKKTELFQIGSSAEKKS